jgi:hypothetical protein
VTYCLDIPNSIQIFGTWIYHWQTLISGFLALFAALLAGALLNRQIKQSEKLAAEQLDRRHNAARAALPLALSVILDYCQKTADDIASAIETIEGNIKADNQPDNMVPISFDKHEFPENAVQLFFKFIETLSNKSEVKHVAELISQIQIFKARFTSIHPNNLNVSHYLYGLIIDCATVKFLTENLFNYTRFVDESSFAKVGVIKQEEAWSGIQQAAHGLVFERNRLDMFSVRIVELIKGRRENGISPWLEKFEV